MIKFYGYNKCSTCRNAKKWLKKNQIPFTEIDITTNPPSQSALQKIIKQSNLELKNFLNQSGIQYRELNMKEKVKTLSQKEIIQMMANEGRLIKRPIVTDGQKISVGFKEEDFKNIWLD
ncbi:MAG: arsenate reductase family protein [Deltaproteobacteria bacterium]|nr:arsenate reductase family protein [Deltaproteobacteria bacterium]